MTVDAEMREKVRQMADVCATLVEADEQIQVGDVRGMEITPRGREMIADIFIGFLEREVS
jgi:hypothetical protein